MSLEHYQFQLIFVNYTKAFQVLDTVEFRHHYLTQPTLMHADIILHGMNTLSCAVKYSPATTCDEQLRVITELWEILKRWANQPQLTTVPPQSKPKIKDRRKRRKSCIPLTPNTCIPLKPPPLRVPKPTTSAKSLRVEFLGVAAPTTRVET